MRPDGTEQRRITEGGNPFGGRFSPDGRRVLYADNARGKQSGIWVIDVDGKNGRLVFPVDRDERNASAGWSSDGETIAITLAGISPSAAGVPTPVRVVGMDLDGGHCREIDIPKGGMTDMPDWR
jgi:Tol biopolymer transport system component